MEPTFHTARTGSAGGGDHKRKSSHNGCNLWWRSKSCFQDWWTGLPVNSCTAPDNTAPRNYLQSSSHRLGGWRRGVCINPHSLRCSLLQSLSAQEKRLTDHTHIGIGCLNLFWQIPTESRHVICPADLHYNRARICLHLPCFSWANQASNPQTHFAL